MTELLPCRRLLAGVHELDLRANEIFPLFDFCRARIINVGDVTLKHTESDLTPLVHARNRNHNPMGSCC